MEEKNVYLIRWPLKAPGFCQYKKGSKMTRIGDLEQAQKKEGQGTSDHDTQSAIRLHPILVEPLVLGLGRDQSELSVRDHCLPPTLTPNPKAILGDSPPLFLDIWAQPPVWRKAEEQPSGPLLAPNSEGSEQEAGSVVPLSTQGRSHKCP